MGTKRRIIDRGKGGRLRPDIVDAWKRADFERLHILLRLGPWEPSPLPLEIAGPLGCSQDDGLPEYPADRRSLQRSQALQRQLLAVAGWPDCRHEYEKNLRNAEKELSWARERYENPPVDYSWMGTPEAREQRLHDAEEEVEYRRELLAGFEAVRAEWAPKKHSPQI
jgi:hypothetical protein